MDNILGPVLAIAATVVLLLLRKLILSVGKKERDSYGDWADHRPDFDREHGLREEPISQSTPIAVDEFLAELRAKAQEQSPSSRTRSGSTTDFGRTQSNRNEMAEDSW
jgi:hypothetical protein